MGCDAGANFDYIQQAIALEVPNQGPVYLQTKSVKKIIPRLVCCTALLLFQGCNLSRRQSEDVIYTP